MDLYVKKDDITFFKINEIPFSVAPHVARTLGLSVPVELFLDTLWVNQHHWE